MSFIDLTNAPTPPRWFEFLLEPGKLQQHLQLDKCDPSPLQLITLFLKNINCSESNEPNDVYTSMPNDVATPIPQDSFEAKYRQSKAKALQVLSIKVASFLDWDLDVICNGILPIPIQYKLLQAFLEICINHEECPSSVELFATVINNHWFIRSAIAYNLTTLEPQTSSTTMIYLSSLQQQQQAADDMALSNIGHLLLDTSNRLKSSADELRDYIKYLVGPKTSNSVKRAKSAHPFDKAELDRPKMECFDPFKDCDWKQSVRVDSHKFLEAACYDLGRFYFFEESYEDALEMFEIIKSSSDRYPKLVEYLQSASDIIAKDSKPDNESELTLQTNAKREQTEKYLFDCMTQFAQSKREEEEGKMDTNGYEVANETEEDSDLRFEQQTTACRQPLPDNSPWYIQIPTDHQQQQLLELGKGDMCMSRGDFEQAMGCFVSALMLMSDYFRKFSKSYIEEEPYITRMIQCSISLSCYTQAVALCQMTKSLNYTIAFKQLNERICNDCCDDIYECIWNVTLLEYIINLHARRGEVERRTRAIQLIGQLELNENNPEDILREAEHVRRGRFFRIMSNKYL